MRQPKPKTHTLKVWREFFDALADGTKTFEVREDDRSFAVGDTLLLREWDPVPFNGAHGGDFTGRDLARTITFKLPGGKFGIDPRFCVLGLSR